LAKPDSASQESSVKKSKILLVGSYVASRELFRLSLKKWPVSIDIAGSISELQNCKTVYKYAAAFFDFPYLSSEELLSFLQNRDKNFPNCFLLCDKQPADFWQSCVESYLVKPVSDEKLAVVLHPLLAKQSSTPSHEGAG
jgi:CheY-like chemotaxis protein